MKNIDISIEVPCVITTEEAKIRINNLFQELKKEGIIYDLVENPTEGPILSARFTLKAGGFHIGVSWLVGTQYVNFEIQGPSEDNSLWLEKAHVLEKIRSKATELLNKS